MVGVCFHCALCCRFLLTQRVSTQRFLLLLPNSTRCVLCTMHCLLRCRIPDILSLRSGQEDVQPQELQGAGVTARVLPSHRPGSTETGRSHHTVLRMLEDVGGSASIQSQAHSAKAESRPPKCDANQPWPIRLPGTELEMTARGAMRRASCSGLAFPSSETPKGPRANVV